MPRAIRSIRLIDAFTSGVGLGTLTRRRRDPSYLKPISYRDIFALNLGAATVARLLPSIFKRRLNVSNGFEALFKEAFKVNGVFTTANIERYVREHVFPRERLRPNWGPSFTSPPPNSTIRAR